MVCSSLMVVVAVGRLVVERESPVEVARHSLYLNRRSSHDYEGPDGNELGDWLRA